VAGIESFGLLGHLGKLRSTLTAQMLGMGARDVRCWISAMAWAKLFMLLAMVVS
jgi:hypothetical protein